VLDSISGKRTDWRARAALPALKGVSHVYRALVVLRNAAYGAGILKRTDMEVPVISVGNITAGGTGKTPLVELLVKGLAERGRKPAILSRGYGPPVREGEGPRSGVSDEALVLGDNLPGVPHLLRANRVVGARMAIDEHGADSIVCDDAFQHLRLGRDLNVVAIDATFPFGYGEMLPRGLLREPLRGLSRADVFVLTRTDLAAKDDVRRLSEGLRRYSPEAVVALSRHRPVELRGHLVENRRPVEDLKSCRVAAFSAIGNPHAFGMTMRGLGAQVVYAKRFEDHHVYTEAELEAIGAEAAARDAEMVVVTQKDAVKVRQDPGWPIPLYYLAVELELVEGADGFWGAVEAALAAGDARGGPGGE